MELPRIKTRAGHDCIIYTTSAGGKYPIHGAWFNGESWIIEAWKANGRLIESPQRSRLCDLDICNHIGQNGSIILNPKTT